MQNGDGSPTVYVHSATSDLLTWQRNRATCHFPIKQTMKLIMPASIWLSRWHEGTAAGLLAFPLLCYSDPLGLWWRCFQLLARFISSLRWTKWSLTLWKFFTGAFFFFFFKAGRGEIWHLKAGHCGWARGKREPKRRVILINKTGAEFIISSFYQRNGAENKELNMNGVKRCSGGASAVMTRPLSPSSGEKMLSHLQILAICFSWIQLHFDGLLTSCHLFYIWTMWCW